MSESTHDDTPMPAQPENWDDILSQPIARLANDATAGEGGWRAVRDIGSFSPRKQTTPVQLTPVDSVMKLHLPRQAEDDAPEQAKLPDSLADQLSLTWAARKRQRPAEEPEDTGPVWPSSSPSRPAPQPMQAPSAAARQDAPPVQRAETPLWRRPIDLVARALRRETPTAEPAQAAATAAPATPAGAPAAQPAVRQTEAPAPAQPRTTVQRQAEPAPRVTPRLDAATPDEEEQPKQPGAAQERDKPVDLTLAMQPQTRAAETPMTPKNPEEDEDKRSDSVAPVIRADAVQRSPEARVTPVARHDEVAAPAPQPGPTPRMLEDTPPVQDDESALPEAPQPERRSFLSWLRPRDVARAPVDRELPRDAEATPQPAAPTVQRVADAPSAAPQAPLTRTTQPQQTASLPTGDMPLTHRATSAPEPEPRDDAVPSLPATSVPSQPAAATPAAAAPPEPGDPLPPGLQQRMEGLLDVPLREVRIFRGQTSQRLTSQLRADAVTVGNQIHVAPGRGDPSQPQGRALLGHELSHVASRQGGEAPVQRDDSTTAGPPLPVVSRAADVSPQEDESRAMRLEHAMLRSEAPSAPRPAPQPVQPLSLEHRAPPPQIVVSPEAMTSVRGLHADGWGGQGAAFQAAMNDVATAPWDRLADQAESMAGTAANSAIDRGAAMASQGLEAAGSAAKEAAGNALGDEDGLIDRVVDAVISRIEQEGAVARERSSSFVPHFGG